MTSSVDSAAPKSLEAAAGRDASRWPPQKTSTWSWTWTKDQARRLQGLDHAPVRPVAAQDLDLCAQLLEELGEVESEGVSIVEDDDHSAQDASFRGLKAKKTASLVSRLAVGPSWNKVPR